MSAGGADDVIAVIVAPDVVLAGIHLCEHRTIEVVEASEVEDGDGPRTVLTVGEARTLVRAGFAHPVTADFEALEGALFDAWRGRPGNRSSSA